LPREKRDGPSFLGEHGKAGELAYKPKKKKTLTLRKTGVDDEGRKGKRKSERWGKKDGLVKRRHAGIASRKKSAAANNSHAKGVEKKQSGRTMNTEEGSRGGPVRGTKAKKNKIMLGEGPWGEIARID